MKFKKLRYGSVALALTAAVIVAVILLNAGATALFGNRLWFLDMTSEKLYTLTEPTVSMLKDTFDEVNAKREQNNEEDVKVDIIFCADPDMLTGNEKMRYIYYTALAIQKKFPDAVRVSSTNVWTNPSAVDSYRTNSYSSIYQSHIIIASGTEFRTTDIKNYYTYDTDGAEEPWAYNGEKIFVRNIIAVTRAEAPICGITTNHGEPFATEEGRAKYSELLNVLKNAGYNVQYLDLSKEEIPEDCRLILTFDPQTDFTASAALDDRTSEISKLNRFMDATYSFMIFADAETPVLTNLEDFLAKWGIRFDRYADTSDPDNILGNYRVVSETSLDSAGLSVIGEYEQYAVGGSVTENMRKRGGSPKVVFGNSISISYSPTYELAFDWTDSEAKTGAFSYGSYYRNQHSRAIFDVFRSGDQSVAQVMRDGSPVLSEDGKPLLADTRGDYKLMTITRESRTVGEGQGYTTVNDASYVCAIGSTEFASNEILGSNSYGNTDLLLETLRSIGREVVGNGLQFKPLYSAEMSEGSETDPNYTKTGNTVWTVVLVLIPAIAFSVTGTVLLVRRKFRS